MRKNKKSGKEIKENIAATLRIPKDILPGCSMLSAMGNKELRIENYRGIIEYTDEMIYIQGKTGKIMIEGTGLNIDYYSNEDMKINGVVHSIKYL